MRIELITSDGAKLARDAKAQNKKIVFTRAKAGSHYDIDGNGGELIVKQLSWYDGAVGAIDAVNPRADGLLVRAAFSAIENTNDPIKAVCILAQLEKTGISPVYDPKDDIIFAAWCDESSLYSTAKACSFDFDLPINLVDVVDKSGSIGDYMTTNTNQQISGVKSYSDDGTTTTRIAGTVDIFDAVETDDTAISITNTDLSVFPDGLGHSESMTNFEWCSMPLSATFNTETNKIEFILGDGRCFEVSVDAIQEI
jgi:hypothetical protein